MTDLNPLFLRPLGQTGLQVSALGLGTVKFGRNTGVKYPTSFELPTDQQICTLLATARELGINLLDTAPAYGSSEERLGALLSDRSDWIVCTKTGEEFHNGQSRFDFSAQHTRMSVERSLQRLRTDYLDIVLVHSDGNDEAIIQHTDCFATLARMKEEGYIRAFGLSGKTVAGGLLALEQADIVMVTYNRNETAEKCVIEEAHRQQKGVLIKKALASGHAVQHSSAAPDDASGTARDSLRFALQPPGVSAIIVGTLSPAHLRDNVSACH